MLLPSHSGICFYWIILTYAMLPSHSDICYVTKLFWHRLLPNHSDMLLPSHSDICHVTKSFWHMLCYQNVLTCYVTRLTYALSEFFIHRKKKTYALLLASHSLWHNLKRYVCVGSSDAGKRLVREEDEEGSDEERITMTVNRSAIDRERRREAFMAAQDAGS